jgi:tripartite-type tricarboxylate transporter receptor subunit TctC
MATVRVLIAVLTAGGFTATASCLAAAEPYPTRPIKMIVGQPPGGPTDTIARLVSERLSAVLGQPVIVDNRPGAGATLGTKVVASAEADGYTLLLSPPGPLTVSPAIKRNLGYDPVRSFAPVALIGHSPQILVVHPSVPATSVDELVVYAKAHPGKLNLGIPGYGTQVHLVGELFKLRTGVIITTVPYKGTAGGISDVVAGQVQMYFEPTPLVLPLAQAGKLRPLAILSERRHPQMSDVPTMAELGFGDFLVSYWAGVLAPANAPALIVGRLNGVINESLKSGEMQASLAKLDVEPKPGSPQEFATFIAAEAHKWTDVAKAAGVSMD